MQTGSIRYARYLMTGVLLTDSLTPQNDPRGRVCASPSRQAPASILLMTVVDDHEFKTQLCPALCLICDLGGGYTACAFVSSLVKWEQHLHHEIMHMHMMSLAQCSISN